MHEVEFAGRLQQRRDLEHVVERETALDELITAEPDARDEVGAEAVPHRLDHLASETQAIVQAAAVLVRAAVAVRRHELRHEKADLALDLDAVETRLARPRSLFPFPFPSAALAELGERGDVMVVELSVGQMAEDVQLALGRRPLLYARPGGVVPTLAEVAHVVRTQYETLEANS